MNLSGKALVLGMRASGISACNLLKHLELKFSAMTTLLTPLKTVL